jgi:hypothetical protein
VVCDIVGGIFGLGLRMIDWIDRNHKLPPQNVEVLAWGQVPSLPPSTGYGFLGTTRRVGNGFALDGTGHCGLVRVTHWAGITGPEERGAA